MTQVLARVADARDASMAAAAGFDVVEFELTGSSSDQATLLAIGAAFKGIVQVGLATAAQALRLPEIADACRVDQIVAPVTVLDTLPGPVGRQIVRFNHASEIDSLGAMRSRIDGVVLDSGPHARLLGTEGIKALSAFAAACRQLGLPFGFAGGLETPDVVRLLMLRPDVLGFDTAARIGHEATAPLDPKALEAIRALVPRAGGRADDARADGNRVIDRIFVRDLDVPFDIGAYKAEVGRSQRVRFSVTAEVARILGVPRDMRDVFSYDIIVETIRVLADRGHVVFVETLAEEIAQALLAYPDLQSVTVRVEKLDIVPGTVGIEIERRRPA